MTQPPLFNIRQIGRLHPVLYRATLAAFQVCRTWAGAGLTGPERGRAFEQALYDAFGRFHLELGGRAGGHSIRGSRSASGFLHESDGVIVAPDVTVHIEAKHLTGSVPKNELLIFNQKGFDYLAADAPQVRKRPFYRLLVSGTALRPEARSFAMMWGIGLVEPDRIPIPLLHWLAGSSLEWPVRPRTSADVLWRSLPRLVAPLQDRIRRLSDCVGGRGGEIITRTSLETMAAIQLQASEVLSRLLDERFPQWLETGLFDALSPPLHRTAA